jgi:hypothetical protein
MASSSASASASYFCSFSLPPLDPHTIADALPSLPLPSAAAASSSSSSHVLSPICLNSASASAGGYGRDLKRKPAAPPPPPPPSTPPPNASKLANRVRESTHLGPPSAGKQQELLSLCLSLRLCVWNRFHPHGRSPWKL